MGSIELLNSGLPVPVLSCRKVTNIAASIPPGHFLVYAFTTRDHIRCDRYGKFLNGTNEAGSLFESLDDAKDYASGEAEKSPNVGFGIYDSSYAIVGEYLSSAYKAKRQRAQTPGRLAFWASVMLMAGSALLWVEVRSGWTLMFGFLAGSRLIFSGCWKLGAALYQLKGRVTH